MTVRQVHSGGAESVIDHTRDFWKYSACLLIKEQEPVTRSTEILDRLSTATRRRHSDL